MMMGLTFFQVNVLGLLVLFFAFLLFGTSQGWPFDEILAVVQIGVLVLIIRHFRRVNAT